MQCPFHPTRPWKMVAFRVDVASPVKFPDRWQCKQVHLLRLLAVVIGEMRNSGRCLPTFITNIHVPPRAHAIATADRRPPEDRLGALKAKGCSKPLSRSHARPTRSNARFGIPLPETPKRRLRRSDLGCPPVVLRRRAVRRWREAFHHPA